MQTRWGLIVGLWLVGLGAAGQYAKISVPFAQMRTLYPEAGGWLGFTVSFVGLVGILLGVVAGAAVAAMGYRRALVLALWVGAAMSAVQALGIPLWLFLTTRIVEGISHLGIVVAAPTLIAQLSAERDRGAALTLWSTFFAVAYTLMVWAGLPIVARFGVGGLCWTHAMVLAVFALVLPRLLRTLNPPEPVPMPALRDLPRLHRAIYGSARISAPAAGWLFYTCCFLAILTVLPPHIAEAHRAMVMGAMPLVSIACSMTLGVWLMRRVPGFVVVQAGFAVSAACMAWLWLAPGQPVACLALAAGFGLVQGATFASVPQLNATASARAQANGALAQTGNLGNTLGTPLMLWALSGAGFAGLTALTILLLLTGLLVHHAMALRRAREECS